MYNVNSFLRSVLISARKSSSSTTRAHIRVLVFCFYSHKQILFLDFLCSQRERAEREQFWPSPKKWVHSAKPMYGRYASCYSSVFATGTLSTPAKHWHPRHPCVFRHPTLGNKKYPSVLSTWCYWYE